MKAIVKLIVQEVWYKFIIRWKFIRDNAREIALTFLQENRSKAVRTSRKDV